MLTQRLSAIDADVERALETRRWSLATASPGSPAFARMAHFCASPAAFEGVRVLRYIHSDLLRLGLAVEGAPSNSAEQPPLRLHPAHSSGSPDAALLIPLSSERSVVIRAGDSDSADLADELVKQLAIRSLGLRTPGLVQLSVIDPLRSGATFRELGQLHGIGFERTELATDSDGVSSMVRRLREGMTDVILASSAVGDRSLEDSLRHDRQLSVPFRVLCVFGFPRAFDDRSIHDLNQLCSSGDQAGIHVFLSLHAALLKAMPETLGLTTPQDLFVGNVARVHVEDSAARHASIDAHAGRSVRFSIDPPLSDSEIGLMVRTLRHDREVRDVHRLSPIEAATAFRDQSASPPSTDMGVSLLLGTDSVDRERLVTIPFGRDIAHHALLVGATGSGKTRLLQGMVAAACLQYSPDQLQFWLLDFKSGTGFKPFASASTPHCRVIGLSSDVTYGLNALRKLFEEMNDRQTLFKQADVENLEQFNSLRRRSALPTLPRIVAVIDEFQTLFTRDTANMAETLMAQIVQKGRSAGIHLLLCTQSLDGQAGGIHSLRSQIKVIIVLQSSASTQRGVMDSYDYLKIHKLRRFEGLLDIDGTSVVFDVLDMPDSAEKANPNLHAALSRVPRHSTEHPTAMVYDGDADVPLPTCSQFQDLVRLVRTEDDVAGTPLLMGMQANVTRVPAYAELRCAMNGNVVISTTDDRLLETQLVAVVLSVSADEAVDSVEVDLLQPSLMGKVWRSLAATFPSKIVIAEHDPSDVPRTLQSVTADLATRSTAHRRLVIAREWKQLPDFDEYDSYGPLRTLLTAGPPRGVHVISATSSGQRTPLHMRDSYSVRIASATSQEISSRHSSAPIAIGRMLIESSSCPDHPSEFLPYTHS